MLGEKDIAFILDNLRAEYNNADEREITFVALCSLYKDKKKAFHIAYRCDYGKDIKALYNSARIKKTREMLKQFGIGGVTSEGVSKEQNKEALIKMIPQINAAMEDGSIEPDKGLKMIADIRVKLNDKFEMEESAEKKRIIIVPAKHDIICTFTHRECSRMPSREACKEYYNLVDAEQEPAETVTEKVE